MNSKAPYHYRSLRPLAMSLFFIVIKLMTQYVYPPKVGVCGSKVAQAKPPPGNALS